MILENAYLTDDEKVAGSKLTEEAGAAYVKTSTGYATERGDPWTTCDSCGPPCRRP